MDIIAEKLVKCNIAMVRDNQEQIQEATRRNCECLEGLVEDLQDQVEDPEMLGQVDQMVADSTSMSSTVVDATLSD